MAAVAGTTIYIWNVVGAPQSSYLVPAAAFVPDDDKISSLLYSSSLISAHRDKKIRFWQVDYHPPDPTVMSAKSAVAGDLVKITCITLQTKEGVAISVDSAGMVKLWDLATGIPKVLLQAFRTAAFAGAARLIDGILTIAFCGRKRTSGLPDNAWKISTLDAQSG